MNLNPSVIVISLIVILAIPYLISVIRKVQNHHIPLINALNPFFTKEMQEAAVLRQSLSPIVREIETQQVAKFIQYWTAKFESGNFTEKDVLELNEKIENGGSNQVSGILALHPSAKTMFNDINERLKLKDEVLTNNEEEVLV